jgi:DNA-binding Xre family transcriptional regulator
MTLTEPADRVGITPANLSILKTGKAEVIRFPGGHVQRAGLSAG